MSFKAFAKLVFFLAMLFVVTYIGVSNRQSAEFNFPLVLAKKTKMDAWEIYFGMFAIGVFAGAVLMAGGKGKGRSSAKAEK